ncbi:unnamed protein product [Microthlaspi erraticum]|uniref:SURP motif domain-containing protein n=1 Tax=Microthlaspi erraticum TaxID=1685480 RepID=A0A6D2HC50_9BRAS|nr:unnamed protein product [Microthlaspi erraticum]
MENQKTSFIHKSEGSRLVLVRTRILLNRFPISVSKSFVLCRRRGGVVPLPAKIISSSKQFMDHSDLPSGQNDSKKMSFPAPHLRAMIETTALFVFRNGVEFEETFLERGKEKGRYLFLRKSDPFHAFYQRHLTRFIEEGDPLDLLKDKSLGVYKCHMDSVKGRAANRLKWEQRMQRLKDERAAKIPDM